MTTIQDSDDERDVPEDDFDREEDLEERERAQVSAHVAALSKHWRHQHERDARRREKALFTDAPGALADERLVLSAAAHDAALAASLWQGQVQIAARINATLDDPRLALVLAKALKELTTCRNAATTRAEQLLVAASTLRTQRRLANLQSGSHLRRVV